MALSYLQSSTRNRGVILTASGLEKLDDANVIRDKRGNRQTFEILGGRSQLSPRTIAKILNVQSVDKRTLKQFFETFNLTLEPTDYTNSELPTSTDTTPKQDLLSAIEVSTFYGRKQELATLEQWIVQEQSRLVALLGMGGIGKSVLSVKLTEQIQDHFEFVIWKTLRNAPPLSDLLAEIILFLSQQQEINLPQSVGCRLSLLLKYLSQQRCLLVLDNVEAIFEGGKGVGVYQPGYQGYGELFQQVAQMSHQSCLVLTSREKPKEVRVMQSDASVRCLELQGLNTEEGRVLFDPDHKFSGSTADWQEVIEHYGGNPLALKMVSPLVQEYLNGDLTEFAHHLRQGQLLFEDLGDLLSRQFNRLTDLEQQVMFWLAIHRDWVTLAELHVDIMPVIALGALLKALDSLRQRSLIEKTTTPEKNTVFTLQPVVMEYVSDRLLSQVCQEIKTQKIDLFDRCALMQATAKDYVRETQIRFILQPLLNQLLTVWEKKRLEAQFCQILEKVRNLKKTGYSAGNILNLQCLLQTDFHGYDFSHLTIRQANLNSTTLHKVNFADADLSQSIFTESFGGIQSVAFSPDGTLLAMGDIQGLVHLWQVEGSKRLFTLIGHTGWVGSVAFGPDGQTIVSSSADTTLKLWDVHTGECLRTFRGHQAGVWVVAFSPDGQFLASGSHDRTNKLWQVSTGKYLKTLDADSNFVRGLAFSPSGQTLASSGAKTINIWNIRTGQCLKTLSGHDEIIWSIAFSPDGQTIASANNDKLLRLWDVNTGHCFKTLQGHQDIVFSLTFSPDGRALLSGGFDQTIKLWDISTGGCLRTLYGHHGLVRSVGFSLDGQRIVSGGDDQTVKLWDVSTGKCLKTLHGYSNNVWAIAFTIDGQLLTSNNHHQVLSWNLTTGQCLKMLSGQDELRTVAFSPDRQTLATTSIDCTIRLWDILTGNCRQILVGHTSWVWSIAFSPDGQTIASGGTDQILKLWNGLTGQCVQTLQEPNHGIVVLSFSPDGQMVASGGTDNTVKLWDTSTGKCLRTLSGHHAWIWSVAFSPDGQMIASGCCDQTIKLWNVYTGNCWQTLVGHVGMVRSLAWSQDGQTLVSGGADQTLKFWDIESGVCVRTIKAHTQAVLAIALTSDGQLASSSEDGTIKIWDLKTGICLKTLSSIKPYEGMAIAGVTGITQAQKSALKALGASE